MKFSFLETKNPADITNPNGTLGIEVTIPEVAALCHLGNLDGQHSVPGTYARYIGRAAIDIAATEAAQILYNPGQQIDPDAPGGVTLVTCRADLDSVGAMAVLVLRALGLGGAEWCHDYERYSFDLPSPARDRIMAIANADGFVRSDRWEPSPLPTVENPWPRAGAIDSTKGLAHLGMICSPRRGDVTLPLNERVAVIAHWLLFEHGFSGDVTERIYEACGVVIPKALEGDRLSASQAARVVLINAFYAVADSRRALAEEATKPGAVRFACPYCGTEHLETHWSAHECARGLTMGTSSGDPLGIAIVRVSHAGAMGLGYCVAPVVVAFDRANPGKVTIAAYSPQYLDWPALKDRLNALEPGWGGNETSCILGSPQRGGTKLTDSTIIEEVRQCLK